MNRWAKTDHEDLFRRTLAQKTVFRERLFVIIYPSSQVGIRVCLNISRGKECISHTSQETLFRNILIDVCCCWEIGRVTTYVDGAYGLIDSNVIDTHGGGESEVLQIYKTEIQGHAQIHNNVLEGTNFNDKISAQMILELTIGSCGIGRADISTRLSAAIPATFKVQATVPLDTQVIYYI